MPDKLITKLPKATPTWAVGIVAVIISLATSFTAFYALSRDEVRTVIANNTQAEAEEREVYSSTLRSVLDLVANNTAQITEMAKSVAVTQAQNLALSERVANLEKKLSITEHSLEACEKDLSVCKKK